MKEKKERREERTLKERKSEKKEGKSLEKTHIPKSKINHVSHQLFY
jgi:hypothetical protein